MPSQPRPPVLLSSASLRSWRRPVAAGRTALGLLLAAALLGTAGCSNRPPAVSVPLRPQPVLQSAGHWQVVADDVASAISAHLEFQTGKKVPVQLYMMRQEDSVFADAFLSAVTTRLVGLGHLVAVDPRPDVTAVGIDVLTVKTDPAQRRSHTAPGPLTILASGVAVAANLADRFPWGSTGIAGALLADTALARPEETDTEMILTVSIAREGYYTFRSSAVYYINGRDLGLYQTLDGGGWRNLNDVPSERIGYDLGGKPYVLPRRR